MLVQLAAAAIAFLGKACVQLKAEDAVGTIPNLHFLRFTKW